MRAFVFAIFVGMSALVATSEISAQRGDGPQLDPAAVRAANNRFAGIWKLVSQETRDGVLYFNPGSAGPRRFKLPVSVGKLIIDAGGVRGDVIHLAIPEDSNS